MSEVESLTKLETFRQANQHAKKILRGVSIGIEEPLLQRVAVPPVVFNKIFTLQAQIEKDGVMDYHKYARQIWRQFTEEDPKDDTGGFNQFEKNMIVGLHQINMRDLIYPSIAKSMPDFVTNYGNDIESIAIWSTGDVAVTGYQAGKIRNSRIIETFLHQLPKTERVKFAKEKTAYIVDDNKLKRFADSMELALKKDSSVKAVIIEDSIANFDKARRVLDERLGAESANVEIVPIWFTGSREGINAQKKVDDIKDSGNVEEYEREKEQLEVKKTKLNAIYSFEELLDTNRFGEIFRGGHVFVDFDGVICDNIQMRERQADVIYNSLVYGIHLQTDQTPEEISKKLTSS